MNGENNILKELIKYRKGDVDVSSIKPKFLSKEEREKLAVERERQMLEKSRTEERELREVSKSMELETVQVSREEKSLIKHRYFGEIENKRNRRTGERRVNFEWDASEDTTGAALSSPRLSQRKDGAIPPKGQTIKTVDQFGNEIEVMVGEKISKKGFGGLDERHWSEKKLKEMDERDWRIFKEDFGISISGGLVPYPIRYWYEAPLSRDLIEVIDKAGYDEPTAIQRQAIPIAVEGRDVLGIAETGSGKTAAFLLPIINRILKLPLLRDDRALEGPYALIMAPTRELALQIEQEANFFCKPLNIRCISIVGGHSMTEQSFNMRNGAEIVIATPGRLRDCLEQRVLVLNQCACLVLDEADRMIDMNFEEDLHQILEALPDYVTCGRQTTMFSATMPLSVEKLVRLYLYKPATVTVGQTGQVAETVEQRTELMKEADKDHRLLEILKSPDFTPPVIIFVREKRTVDYLYKRLDTLGFRCTALHGGKSQEQREAAIGQLRRNGRDILIATDVAGRGIDIKDVTMVINYDMAKSIEDYTHRVGRTGRMGKSGIAVTFLTTSDAELFYDLRVILQKSPKSVIPTEFLMHESSRIKPGTVIQKKRHQERIYAYGV